MKSWQNEISSVLENRHIRRDICSNTFLGKVIAQRLPLYLHRTVNGVLIFPAASLPGFGRHCDVPTSVTINTEHPPAASQKISLHLWI